MADLLPPIDSTDPSNNPFRPKMQPDDILTEPHAHHFTATTHNDTYPYISPTDPSNNLDEKYYLVTGASKGIGRSIVISLAKAGASGIACLARSSVSSTVEAALHAAKDANRAPPKIIELSVDMTDRAAVEDAAATVQREFGRLDVLVNNAGSSENWRPLVESDPDEWWRAWEVNLKGTYFMDRTFIPLLLKRGDKTIVTVSSAGALVTIPGASAYQGSKSAQMRLNNHIMAEYRTEGLLAYCIHPGGVLTEMAKGMPEYLHGYLSDQPELAGDTLAWLTREKRDWLAERYLSVCWDMQEFLAKKEDIVSQELLTVKLRV